MKSAQIAVIMNQIEGPFFSSQWKSLVKWGANKDFRLLFFTGKALDTPIKLDRNQNFTYNLIDTKQLDGILVFAGSLGNHISQDLMEKKLNEWSSIPLLSINYPVEDFKSIESEADYAIDALVDHLATYHEYKDFAFVTGGSNNYDSIQRYRLFLAALDKKGLSIKKENIFQGDFTPESGGGAAKYFIENGLPEVVICFNDDMAHGFIEKLKSRGLHVPWDVAVTGFDGYPYTEHLFPSLTTIEQQRIH